jgi:signal transduction histidine kinase
MPLARLQWVFLAFALVLLTALTAILVQNHLSVARSLADLMQAQEVVRTVVRMRNIALEATANRTDRQEIQWQAGMREFARALHPLQTAYAEETLLIEAIRVNVNDVDQLFRRLLASAPSQQAGSAGEIAENTTRIAHALHVLLGDVSLMALRLSELQTAEVRAARRNVLWTSAFLVLAMLAILIAYLMVFRILVLAPITQLQAATDRIAGGDLEHRVGLGSKNEFGELGRRFDHMTEQVRVSRARMAAAIKELEAFAYSVSHDLRAPLRGMDAFSQILQKSHQENMDEDAQHCLHMIRDNAQQMGRLIDDLLAFSRLSQQPLRKERVDQEALVRAVLESLQAEQKNRQIELTIGELPAADADPRLLKQVWVNLITNALKYTRSRDKVIIRVGAETKEGVPVYYIQDNGVGFDMRYAHKLFGVFQRLHRAEDYEGTGVGLAIVQRIIARHGGRIWAQAAKNQGATFHFTLQGEEGHEQ